MFSRLSGFAASRLARSVPRALSNIAFALTLAGGSCFAQARPAFESAEIGAFDADAWNGVVFLARASQ